MAKRNGSPERRRHKRFKVKKGFLAVSIPDFKKLGQIKDISKGGLAFQYLGNAEQAKDSVEVEILSIADDFYLRKLPVRTVLDFEINNPVSLSLLPKRQLSMKFGKLNHYQKELLTHFLQRHTHK
jgi:hypothetical protein